MNNSSVLRETIKKILLISAAVIGVLGIVATIIGATQYKGAGVAWQIFEGLMTTISGMCLPGGLYALLIGQDMMMRHQGVPMPQQQPRFQTAPQQPYGQPQGYPQQPPQQPQQPYGGQPQGGYPQQPNNYQ